MTENEAIQVFKELLDVPCEMLVKYDSVTTEEQKNALVKIRVAEDMAIQVLEEIQQYRAIGTVEDYWKLNEMCKEYSAIGTIEEFKDLKEKNEPKKLMHNGANWYRCPNGCEVHKKTFEKDWYCPKCGVKLDWSE